MRMTIAALALLVTAQAAAEEPVTIEIGGVLGYFRVQDCTGEVLCKDPLAVPSLHQIMCERPQKLWDKLEGTRPWLGYGTGRYEGGYARSLPTGNGVLAGWSVIVGGEVFCADPIVHVTEIRCPAPEDPGGEIRLHTPNIVDIIEPKVSP